MSGIKPVIEYPDFEKLDIRVGQIVAVVEPEWSRKLLQFTVDFGSDIGQKTIFSGVKAWYTPADFQDKKAFFIVNLAPRKMGESVSEGMMLMADEAEKPVPFFAPELVALGTCVS